MSLPAVLQFEDVALDVVDRNGQPWLKLRDLAQALYFGDPEAVRESQITTPFAQGRGQTDAPFENAIKSLRRLYERNADEFTDEMTAVIKLDTTGGRQDVRVFSPRGCWLLGMFARTERAKAFRAWVLDVLEGLAAPPAAAERSPGHARRGEADNVVDAGRCFSAYMRVGRAMGLAGRACALRANQAARSRTGIDLVEDLGMESQIDRALPDASEDRWASADAFMDAWAAGELPLPYCPCRTRDLYEAYRHYARQRAADVSDALALSHFSAAIGRRWPGYVRTREFEDESGTATQARVFCPPNETPGSGETLRSWIGAGVRAFGSALTEWCVSE